MTEKDEAIAHLFMTALNLDNEELDKLLSGVFAPEIAVALVSMLSEYDTTKEEREALKNASLNLVNTWVDTKDKKITRKGKPVGDEDRLLVMLSRLLYLHYTMNRFLASAAFAISPKALADPLEHVLGATAEGTIKEARAHGHKVMDGFKEKRRAEKQAERQEREGAAASKHPAAAPTAPAEDAPTPSQKARILAATMPLSTKFTDLEQFKSYVTDRMPGVDNAVVTEVAVALQERTLEHWRGVARGAIEQNLDTDGKSSDKIFNEAHQYSFDALRNEGCSAHLAETIAQDAARNIAQP